MGLGQNVLTQVGPGGQPPSGLENIPPPMQIFQFFTFPSKPISLGWAKKIPGLKPGWPHIYLGSGRPSLFWREKEKEKS